MEAATAARYIAATTTGGAKPTHVHHAELICAGLLVSRPRRHLAGEAGRRGGGRFSVGAQLAKTSRKRSLCG